MDIAVAPGMPDATLGAVLSPFLLLDYTGPMEFAPTDERRGVGEHPHRGFETVTIVYEGEVEHRDSSQEIRQAMEDYQNGKMGHLH